MTLPDILTMDLPDILTMDLPDILTMDLPDILTMNLVDMLSKCSGLQSETLTLARIYHQRLSVAELSIWRPIKTQAVGLFSCGLLRYTNAPIPAWLGQRWNMGKPTPRPQDQRRRFEHDANVLA